MDTSSALSYVARQMLHGERGPLRRSGCAVDYATPVRRVELTGALIVRTFHHCRRRLDIPFDAVELMVRNDAALVDLVAGRMRAFVDLGCLCELRVVVDHDSGDEST